MPKKNQNSTTSSTVLDRAQVLKGVDGLLRHHQSVQKAQSKSQLFNDATAIQLVVTLRQIPPPRVRPIRIPLKHSIHENSDVCVFTKDPQKQFREEFSKRQVSGVSKVIGLSKLKSNYRQFEAKRQLRDSYDLFLADVRILPMLPRLLGKKFFLAKKIPLPVVLKQSGNWPQEISEAIGGTSLTLHGGATLNVLVGRAAMTSEQVVANVFRAMDELVKHVSGWRNVSALYVKTPASVAVPLYSAAPLTKTVARALREELYAARAVNKARDVVLRDENGKRLPGLLAQLGVDVRDADLEANDSDSESTANDSNSDEELVKEISQATGGKSLRKHDDDNDDDDSDVNNDGSNSSNDDDDDDDDDDDEEAATTAERVRKEKPAPISDAERLRRKLAKRAGGGGGAAATTSPSSNKASAANGKRKLSASQAVAQAQKRARADTQKRNKQRKAAQSPGTTTSTPNNNKRANRITPRKTNKPKRK